MQSASDTFQRHLCLIGLNIVLDTVMGKKWNGQTRLLAEVPNTSIKYCKVYKISKRVGSSWVPVLGPRVYCFYLPPNVIRSTVGILRYIFSPL